MPRCQKTKSELQPYTLCVTCKVKVYSHVHVTRLYVPHSYILFSVIRHVANTAKDYWEKQRGKAGNADYYKDSSPSPDGMKQLEDIYNHFAEAFLTEHEIERRLTLPISVETSTLKRAQMTGIVTMVSLIEFERGMAIDPAKPTMEYQNLRNCKFRIKADHAETGRDKSNVSKLDALFPKFATKNRDIGAMLQKDDSEKYFENYLVDANNKQFQNEIWKKVIGDEQIGVWKGEGGKDPLLWMNTKKPKGFLPFSHTGQRARIKKVMTELNKKVIFIFGHSHKFMDLVKV